MRVVREGLIRARSPPQEQEQLTLAEFREAE